MPQACQGLGESRSQGPRLLAPRFNSPHAQKTLQSAVKSPDRLPGRFPYRLGGVRFAIPPYGPERRTCFAPRRCSRNRLNGASCSRSASIHGDLLTERAVGNVTASLRLTLEDIGYIGVGRFRPFHGADFILQGSTMPARRQNVSQAARSPELRTRVLPSALDRLGLRGGRQRKCPRQGAPSAGPSGIVRPARAPRLLRQAGEETMRAAPRWCGRRSDQLTSCIRQNGPPPAKCHAMLVR
jgi:hypothetical protein